MSWKPCRGSGINFRNASARETKYRIMLAEYAVHPVGYMEYSKTYYHWLVAERDLRSFTPSQALSLQHLYGRMIPASTLRNLEKHRELCYKPLQKLMPQNP